MKKRFFAVLLTLCMVFTLLPVSALAADGDSKALTVDQGTAQVDGQTYTTIQDAINYINTQEGKTGWTITVSSGTYARFGICRDMNNLTIQAAEGADVTINTCDGSALPIEFNANTIYAGVYLGDNTKGVTLDGLTFSVGTEGTATNGYVAAITTFNNQGGAYADNYTIKNCTFNGQGAKWAIFNGQFQSSYTVTNCVFNNVETAIQYYCDGQVAGDISITYNIFNQCSYATHGYYYRKTTDNTAAGTLLFANNILNGTSDLRCKAYFEDKNDDSSIRVDIKNNTFNNAMVGVVNMNKTDGDVISDVLTSNTLGAGFFYVEASKATGEVELSSNYEAPEYSTGKWILTDVDDLEVSWSPNPEGTIAYVQSVIDAANENNSKTLTFTNVGKGEGEDFYYTFTWFKDAIYWDSDSSQVEEKTSYPGADKYILDDAGKEQSSGSVGAGGTVTYELKSNVPKDLTNYLKAATPDDAEVEVEAANFIDNLNGGVYKLAFHDVLAEGLTIDGTKVAVKVGNGEVYVYEYSETDKTGTLYAYTKNADGTLTEVEVGTYTLDRPCSSGKEETDSLYVELNLVTLYNAVDEKGNAYFVETDFGTAPIVVTYQAKASATLAPGTYQNTVWVEYENGSADGPNVPVYSYGFKIHKIDQTTGEGLDGAKFKLIDANGKVLAENLTSKTITTTTTSDDGTTTTEDKQVGWVIWDTGLKAGTYYLYETQAPDGYIASVKPLTLVLGGEGDELSSVIYLTGEFKNSNVPHTGGTGTVMFTLGGAALIAAAGAVLVTTRKKGEHEN